MRRLMNRLREKDGSVLFLVVVVMSILILAASATYYVVTNQRSSTYVRFSNEQSYQTALSVSNTVWSYISGYLSEMNGKEVKDYQNTVVGKMLAGKTLTASDLDLTDMGLGKVDVQIKRSPDVSIAASGENTANVFEITVTAEVNGETTSITRLINIQTGPTEYFTRFLTCTGDSGEDVIISAGNLFGAAYFENEFTNFTQGATHINDSLYATGTVVDTGAQYITNAGLNPDDYEIVINKNFYIEKSDGGDLNNKYLFVGGNFELNDNKQINSKEVYIMGDCTLNGAQGGATAVYFINGDLHIDNNSTQGCTFYVNGDLYLGNPDKALDQTSWHNAGNFYVNKNVYINGNGNNSGTNKIVYGGDLTVRSGVSQPGTSEKNASEVSSKITSAFADSIFNSDPNKKVDFANWSDIKPYIESSTTKQKYQEWDAEGYFNSKNTDNSAPTIDLDNWNSYLGTEYIRTEGGKDYFRISNKNFILKSFDNISQRTVVVNASTQNVYIKLEGETEPTTGRKVFKMGNKSASTAINFLITGKKSVIFVLPADTDFVMGTHVVVGHRDFLLPFTGRTFTQCLGESLAGPVEANKNNINNYLKTITEGNTTSKILDYTKVTGNAHNNIFLVTKGNNNNFDFNAQANFCGYLYAPKGTMDCNSSSDRFAFFGGLIMGGYTYVDTSGTLAFTTPYDYYGNYTGKKTNYVKNLMSEANSGGDGDSASSTSTVTGYDGNLGYK